ncbi:hypothetical protein [Paraglaciecola sp. L3A3]|uniref:hypothetical protein n=1 Tax=Paraglaciecola sp. L3A3 TaxID=2686358 RepID=UPI00131C91D9|nr:hypothetical protein [Paraglaciecola sp. L3A3]
MKRTIALGVWFVSMVFSVACISASEQGDMLGKFDTSKDLFLPQFDSKTDVDDIHAQAAIATMLAHPKFAKVKYHAVAGAYGIQEGLYVPSAELFDLAFGNNWSDAHINYDKALKEVTQLVVNTLKAGGDIWIAEAGQSDFSADIVRALHTNLTDIDVKTRVHIVQHSKWNEGSTSPKDLDYVRDYTDYEKIADGNAVGNGTPGFNTENIGNWPRVLNDKQVGNLWKLAKEISNQYNGKDGRYDNAAITAGGFDFSDTVEVCWIFGYNQIKNTTEFFDVFASK